MLIPVCYSCINNRRHRRRKVLNIGVGAEGKVQNMGGGTRGWEAYFSLAVS